jgi:hypothetical protein
MKISSEKLNEYLVIPLQLWFKSDKYNGHYMKAYLLYLKGGAAGSLTKYFLRVVVKMFRTNLQKHFRIFIMFSGPGWLSRYSDSHTGWTDRIPVGGRFFSPLRTGPGGPSSLLYDGYRVSFYGAKRLWSFMAWSRVNFIFLLYGFQYHWEGGKPVKNHRALAVLEGTWGAITLNIFLSSPLIILFVDYTN